MVRLVIIMIVLTIVVMLLGAFVIDLSAIFITIKIIIVIAIPGLFIRLFLSVQCRPWSFRYARMGVATLRRACEQRYVRSILETMLPNPVAKAVAKAVVVELESSVTEAQKGNLETAAVNMEI